MNFQPVRPTLWDSSLLNRSETITQPEQFSWNSTSPSPRPSPPRRGRTFSSAGKGSQFSKFFRRDYWQFPLLGERARVRASVISDSMDSSKE